MLALMLLKQIQAVVLQVLVSLAKLHPQGITVGRILWVTTVLIPNLILQPILLATNGTISSPSTHRRIIPV